MNAVLFILNAAAALLIIHMAVRCRGGLGRRRLATATCLTALGAVTAAFFWGCDPRILPADLITFLQEGPQIRAIQALYNNGIHAGPNFLFFVDALFPGQAFPNLPYLTAMNLWLAACNALLFLIIALHIVDDIWIAGAFTLFFSLNAVTLNSSASELPSQLLTLYFLLGVIAVFTRAAALGGALTLLALATRWEASLVGFGFLAALAHARWARACLLSRWLAPCLSARERVLSWPARRKLWISLTGLVFWGIGRHLLDPWPKARWIFEGLYPFNPSPATLPLLLLHFLPIGVVILAVLGLWRATRHMKRFCLLPVSLLTLYKLYYSASHGVFFERLRYLTMLMPVLFFLGLHGWKLAEMMFRKRRWDPSLLRAAFALSLFLWLPSGPSRRPLETLFSLTAPGLSRVFLSRNTQTETRLLVNLVRRYPNCVFASQIFSENRHLGRPAQEPQLAFFGGGLPAPVFASLSRDRSLPQRALETSPANGCLMLYQGLDSNDRALIPQDAPPAAALEQWSVPSEEYSDPQEYGAHGPVIHRALYRLRP